MTTKIILHAAVVAVFVAVFCHFGRPWLLLFAAVAAVCWVFWRHKNPALARTPYYLCMGAAAVTAAALSLAATRTDAKQKLLFAEEEAVTAAGTVTAVTQHENSISLTLAASACQAGRQIYRTGKILVYADADDPIFEEKEKLYGASVKAAGSTEPFSQAKNDGAFDEKNYYGGKGINGKLYADSVEIIHPCINPFLRAAAVFRQALARQYGAYLPEREAGVIAGMLLGEKSGVDREVKALYQESGIAHLLSISGLHVSLIGMSLYRFLQKLRCPKKAAAILAASLGAAYVVMSGASVSACRAGGMFVVMMLSYVWNRQYEGRTALALMAAVQLVCQPEMAADTGFLYSYLAAAAILYIAQPLGQAVQLGKIGSSFMLSACIQIVQLPLSMYCSFEIVFASLLLNIVVLPLASPLLLFALAGGVGAAACGALSGIWPVWAQHLSDLVLRGVFWPVRLILQLYEWLCGWAGKLPFASVLTGKPQLEQVVFAYLLMLVAWIIWDKIRQEPRKGVVERRRPEARLPEKRIGPQQAAAAERRRPVVAAWKWPGVLLAAGITVLLYRPPVGFRLAMLDVGQGDGIFLQTDKHHSCFIDGGSTSQSAVGTYQILPFLKANRVGGIDYWFVSHMDTDHISGIIEVLESGYPVRFLICAKAQEVEEELAAAAKAAGTEILYVESGQRFSWGDTAISILAPDAAFQTDDANAASLVLYWQSGDFCGLFGGDIGQEQEEAIARDYDLEDITCFKADHHGSKYSNCEALLEEIRPQVTIISAGEGNRYGHPHAEALERIRAVCSEVFLTAETGQITLVEEKGGFRVSYPYQD